MYFLGVFKINIVLKIVERYEFWLDKWYDVISFKILWSGVCVVVFMG